MTSANISGIARKTVPALLALLLVSGCTAVGPNYRKPEVAVPDVWSEKVDEHLSEGSPVFEDWWEELDDPVLPKLIEMAREANPTLAIAFQRINVARSRTNIASSGLFPSVNLEGSSTRTRTSENTVRPPFPDNPYNRHGVGFTTGWELDVFGAVRRSVESAQADTEANSEAYRDILVALLADVAVNYVEVRTFDERLRLADENIRIISNSKQLTSSRFRNGLVSELDLRQAESNLAAAQSLTPELIGQRQGVVNRLAVLLGKYPGELDALLDEPQPIPTPTRDFGIGLPTDLIRNRPDIRRAERSLAAQTARVGVATADLYPRFVLLGAFSVQAQDFGNLAKSDSRAWFIGPAMRWNIFNAGRIRSQIDIEETNTRIALLQYENTLLQAVSEVETTLASIESLWKQIEFKQRQVTANARSVLLVQVQYEQGLVEFQNVLDTERTKIFADDDLATRKGTLATRYVDLYRRLGGSDLPG